MLPFTVHPVGDCALLAGFTQRIAPEIGAAVAALNSRVLAAGLTLTARTPRRGRGGWSRSLYATAANSAPTCPLWQSTRG